MAGQLNDLHRYNVAKAAWSELMPDAGGSGPSPRANLGMAVVSNRCCGYRREGKSDTLSRGLPIFN